jgi:hypothetical protein
MKLYKNLTILDHNKIVKFLYNFIIKIYYSSSTTFPKMPRVIKSMKVFSVTVLVVRDLITSIYQFVNLNPCNILQLSYRLINIQLPYFLL